MGKTFNFKELNLFLRKKNLLFGEFILRPEHMENILFLSEASFTKYGDFLNELNKLRPNQINENIEKINFYEPRKIKETFCYSVEDLKFNLNTLDFKKLHPTINDTNETLDSTQININEQILQLN